VSIDLWPKIRVIMAILHLNNLPIQKGEGAEFNDKESLEIVGRLLGVAAQRRIREFSDYDADLSSD